MNNLKYLNPQEVKDEILKRTTIWISYNPRGYYATIEYLYMNNKGKITIYNCDVSFDDVITYVVNNIIEHHVKGIRKV